MYDFERGAKVTGSKFYFTTGNDAVKEWDLITDMIAHHISAGYTFVIPPYLVNKTTAEQAGILPRFQGDFYVVNDGEGGVTHQQFILIPTAETALVGMHSDEIFKEEDLPIKYVAFSPCFRREAGASGQRDTGLKRVHQFHKVELFQFVKPEHSEEAHQDMLKHVQDMISKKWPQLKQRTVELSKEDRSPVSNKTYDIELSYKEEWLEVSSISNTGDNQSKLAQIRYKPKAGGKPIKCHLLNGSGLALPRLVLALNEEDT